MGTRAPAAKRTHRPLEPTKSVLLVEGSKLISLPPSEATSSRVGHKAVGLVSIPSVWTTPFFVVCGKTLPGTVVLANAVLESGIRKRLAVAP